MRSVKNKDGEVLTDDERIKDRWKENYEDLYNQPNPKDTSILQILLNNQPSDNEPAILRSEVQSAIKRLKGNKAAGDDGISAEEIKAADDKGVDIIHKLCNQM